MKVTIGSKEFAFTELNLGDLASFKGYLTDEKKKLNEERRQRLVEDAQKIGNVDPLELLKLTDTSISQEEIEAEMESIEGIAYLAYLSLRIHHPEISREDAKEIVTIDSMDAVVGAMFPSRDESKTPKKVPGGKKIPRKSPKQQQ